MAMEVDEGNVLHHRSSQTNVVWVTWIGSAVAIVDALVRLLVFVWPLLARDFGNSRDAQGQIAKGWLENALRRHKWDAAPIELESAL